MPTGRVREDLIEVKKLIVNGERLYGGQVLNTGQAVDINGVADALIMDADGDTTISAPTDDQIDVEIGGSDIYTLTATALSLAAGAYVYSKTPVAVVADDGAISVPSGNTTYFITEDSDGAAMTLVDPTTVTHDGLVLTFISTTGQAHTLDLVTGINGGAADVGTWGGAVGDAVSIVAYGGVWYAVPGANVNVTWA